MFLALAACAEPLPTAPTLVPEAPLRVTSAAGHVTISQVYGGGGNSGATLRNDFIELYNPTSSPVALAGWSVQYAATTGTNWQRSNLSGTIQPGSYYLVQQAQGAGGTVSLPAPDATGSIAMSGTAGKVALVSNQTTIISGTACPSGASIIDFVGFGTSTNCSETAPTATLGNTTAALRVGGGLTDGDNNATDFTIGAPNPRNSAVDIPAVRSTIPPANAANVAVTGNVQVTFNKPVAVSGNWFTIDCSQSGVHPATVTGVADAYTLDPDTDFSGSDTCTVTISGSQVTDAVVNTKAMASDFAWSFGTVDACTAAFTPAYVVQGSGATSPLAGQVLATRGVVVGDYEGSGSLRGFYVQDAMGDGDAATSDAVFVFNAGNDEVDLGDVVNVTGAVAEFQGQTQLSATSVQRCSTGASLAPVDVSLPLATAADLERVEGMLVRFPQTLHVTEHFQLGRFGQVVLSSGGRLRQPTSVAAPGAAANALQAANVLNRIIVDDASQLQNPDPILFGGGGLALAAANTLRTGDTAAGIVGVLTYTWAGNAASGNAYRLRPENALGGAIPAFAIANPRPATPGAVGGTIRVAALNVLNYFDSFSGCTLGIGGGPTDCRGADNAAEFARQWPKTVAAIVAIDADILGIIEIENDGYGASSALADLVGKLNAATVPGTYAYVDADAATGQLNALGTDAIKVGLLYKPARVKPVGATAALNTFAFVNGGDTGPRNRPALAQAFEDAQHGRVVVAVNHLKSKGSGCDAPAAPDGQGECNLVRANAANLLKAWLASDPTGMLDADALIVGDLNSYAKEDPITALRNGGYVDLAATLIGPDAYSYVFDGQAGYLDYALASPSLAPQVTGVTEWHINADEPTVLDYNTEFKTAGQVASLYQADQYRVSDHDPVIVGLDLSPTVVYRFGGFLAPIDAGDVNVSSAGRAIPVKFSLGGDRGTTIFAAGYPYSRAVSCTTGADESAVEVTLAAGQSGLLYDASTDSYTYGWKTEKAWANSCRELVVKFSDASAYRVTFRFTK